MSRRLAKSVLVGGVIYPAGETVPADLAATITADVWEAEAPAPTEAEVKPRRRTRGDD